VVAGANGKQRLQAIPHRHNFAFYIVTLYSLNSATVYFKFFTAMSNSDYTPLKKAHSLEEVYDAIAGSRPRKCFITTK